MAYLYRFDVSIGEKNVIAVIYADDDEGAFQHLDVELEKFYLKEPDVNEITLREKKRIVKKSGFILDEDEKGW
ncbi:DUF3906 family protein [Jeotgalibacillus soli]|uniref:DUF3906 domain-containing protein n=1 Tax=Jeotgalibacillus soli TaxID=889306 RepID=A0A0C2VL72_9BACL|nr:DUF3906 family protein [Jeotgalibacillus soli]KIL49652.1 hypothetical protein KP78_11200 [Jeotgalibacillus soli]